MSEELMIRRVTLFRYAHKAGTALGLFKEAVQHPELREPFRYRVIEGLIQLVYPKFMISDYGRVWLNDDTFHSYYLSHDDGGNMRTAERKFLLMNLLKLIDDVPGDTAECGVWMGASSYLICEYIASRRSADRRHHAFDSFAGLPRPARIDGSYWHEGDLRTSESVARRHLAAFPFADFHVGWIPDTFVGLDQLRFAFVHIDVDLYKPTLDSLTYFYPRMNPGGILLFDDYAFVTCPGAMRACEEFMADKMERIVHCPTGQGFVVKR